MTKRLLKLLCGLGCIGFLMLSVTSCSMDAPKDGVQIKVANKLSSDQVKTLKKVLKAYDSGISSTGTTTLNGKTVINLSPVSDPVAFSKKITCGKVTATSGNVITLDVDITKLATP